MNGLRPHDPLSPVLSVGHTGITVSDLQKSCWFYREILRLEVSDPLRLSGDAVSRITGVVDAVLDVAYVRCPGHVLELLSFVRPVRKEPSQLRACDPGFVHVCLKVRSIDIAMKAVRRAGFEAVSRFETLHDGPATGMRVVYTRDPDGVVLELAQEPPGVRFEELFFQPSGP